MGTHSDDSIREFATRHTAEVEPLHAAAALASWEFATTGKPEAMERAAELEKQYRGIYARPHEYDFLHKTSVEKFTDPVMKRMHRVLLNAYTGHQMSPEALAAIVDREKEVAAVYNNFRADFRGNKVPNNVLDEVLHTSADVVERRDAWEASKQIGPLVADNIRELARMRNTEARRLHFSDYHTQALRLQEFDVEQLMALLGELDRATMKGFTEVKAKVDSDISERCGLTDADQSLPWNYPDPYFQGAPRSKVELDRYFAEKDLVAITSRFFARIGLPVDDLIARSDLFEREGKNQHAFCTDIDRKGDVRVLCNVRPTARWMGTLLHEYGHAVYDKFIEPSLPWLLRSPSHILTTEAVAIFFGNLVTTEAWLTEYAEVPAEEAAAVAAAAREQDRMQKLIFTRWVLVMTNFERAMYQDPDRDLNTLWWELVQANQLVRKPDGRDMPDWATKIHIALAPAYYHNYLLGDLYACQLRHYILSKVLPSGDMREMVTSPKLGEFFRDGLFKMGDLFDWSETIRRTTGEPLNPAYFIRQTQQG